MKKKKMNKKLKAFLIFDAIILIVVIAFAGFTILKPFELKGDAEMTINLGETFEDPGTTSKFAKVEGAVDTSKVGDYTLTYKAFGKKTHTNCARCRRLTDCPWAEGNTAHYCQRR